MSYDFVEWNGDWNKRQPARLGGTTLYLLPLRVQDPAALQAACHKRFRDATGGHVVVESLGPMVLLVCANFEKIHSLDPVHALEGYIREHDVGIFVPVRTSVDGTSRGIGVCIPYLYVDNPAAVIMGREIFGFPKLMASIGFEPGPLRFSVDSLVFENQDPDELAMPRRILDVKRGPFFPFGGWIPDWLAGLLYGDQTITSIEGLANLVLDSLGLMAELGSLVSAFDHVDFVFLKQTRSPVDALKADSISIVDAPGSISNFQSAQLLLRPLFWPAIVDFHDYFSVDIAAELGLAAQHSVRTVFRVDCDLEIGNSEVIWSG